MISSVCALCGADRRSSASSTIDATACLRNCARRLLRRVARYEAGPIMSEGPVTWDDGWPEMEEWLARNVAAQRRRVRRRRLAPDCSAHTLREQLSPPPAGDSSPRSDLLAEFDDRAG